MSNGSVFRHRYYPVLIFDKLPLCGRPSPVFSTAYERENRIESAELYFS